tara:strand:+ start:58381 stop:59826 length:1446 start_codon:yes stop_codon:yes gene_type:complete
MKKMKRIFLPIILVLTFFGCSSELDLLPLNTVTEPTFWKTSDDAITGVNGVYNTLADNYQYRDFYMHSDAITNNGYSQYTFNSYLEMSDGSGFDSSSAIPTQVWNRCYEGIVRANRVITYITDIEMDANLKNRILGESRFLRALFYTTLINLYGDVPLILEIQSIEESLVSRTAKSEVLAQIIDDLNFAEVNLPSSYNGSDIGRATSAAAIGLKSRVYLFDQQYALAISEANKFATLGYDLVPAEQFSDMFLPALENNNNESIFEVQFLGQAGVANVGSQFNQNSGTLKTFGSSVFSPVQELVDIYDEEDIRLTATVLRPGDLFGEEIYDGVNSPTTFAFKKFVIPDPTVTTDGDANFVVMRYAEILLNLAEAQNELNGPDGAYAPINRIRNRAGLEDLATGLTKEQMRDAIKLERRKELAFEGHHYFDLLRYGADDLKEAMESVTSVVGHTRSFQERFMLWPIPQPQININPNLEQNPGW